MYSQVRHSHRLHHRRTCHPYCYRPALQSNCFAVNLSSFPGQARHHPPRNRHRNSRPRRQPQRYPGAHVAMLANFLVAMQPSCQLHAVGYLPSACLL